MKKLKGFKKFIYNIADKFSIKYCKECGSFNIDSGTWISGWNEILGQASGSHGDRCFDCGNIIWT